jgi:hypothetical protein
VRQVLLPCALAGLTALVFANGLAGEFVLDDVTLVREFPCAREPLEPLKGLFLIGGGPCAYRPLRYLSYAADHALWGDDPAGYHAVNLALHLLAVFGVFFLVRRVLRAGPEPPTGDAARAAEFGAFVAAAVFAVHPVQVESVAYVSGRRDLLTALLSLAGVLLFLRYRERGGRWRAAGIVAIFYLALQSKEMAITLPGLLVLTGAAIDRLESPATPDDRGLRGRLADAWRTLAGPVRRHPWLFGALALVAAAFFAWRGVAEPVTHHPTFWGGSRLANTATALGTVPKYVQLVLWPDVLLADYSADAYPIHTTLLAPLPIAGAAIALVLAVVGVFALPLRPRAALAAGWFGLGLLPVMHLVPHHELMAEHYLYLPLAGVAVGVGAVFAGLHARRRAPIALAVAALAVVPLGLRSAVRNFDWRDAWAIWEAELAETDGCARAHASYALLLAAEPERDVAGGLGQERHLRRALEIQARTKAGVSRIPVEELSARLGVLRVRRGAVDEGLALLRWAYRHVGRGTVLPASRRLIIDAYVVTLLNLGQLGETPERRALLEEALPALERWLLLEPHAGHVRFMRDRTREILGRPRAAGGGLTS